MFKSSDDLLNGISDRTIDKDMFDHEYKKQEILKKEPFKIIEDSIFRNIDNKTLNSSSRELNFIDDKNYNNETNEVREEKIRRDLFDSVFVYNNHKIKINKKTITTCFIKDQTLLCKIKKSYVKMKYGKKMTFYHLYTDLTNKFLLSCKKISSLTNTEYIFSMSENPLDCSNDSIIGKVVSKFFGNEYNIYEVSDLKTEKKLIGTVDYVSFLLNKFRALMFLDYLDQEK